MSLNLCPKCNEKAYLMPVNDDNGNLVGYYAQCSNVDGCKDLPRTETYPTIPDAGLAWNLGKIGCLDDDGVFHYYPGAEEIPLVFPEEPENIDDFVYSTEESDTAPTDEPEGDM